MELNEKILEALNSSGVRIINFDFELSEKGNIGGILISNDFAPLDELQRQELVWSKLKLKLTAI